MARSAPSPSFEDALGAIRSIDGWLTDDQARLLFEHASKLRPGSRVVEIGSFRGRSAIILAKAAPVDAEIIAIDPYAGWGAGPEDLEHFNRNLERAGVRDRVRHIADFSSAAIRDVPPPIDLLYIDGAHEFPAARSDISQWGVLVSQGGTMLIHDAYSSVGVTLAQIVLLFFGSRFRYRGRSRSLVVYRCEPMSAGMRLSNAIRQAVQLPWFARNVLVKLALVARARPVARLLGHEGTVFPY